MPEFMRHPPEWLLWLLWASLALVVLRVLWILVPVLPLYLKARVAGAPVGFLGLVGLQLRAGVSGMRRVVDALILANSQGGGPTAIEAEAHHLAGGDVTQAAGAFDAARRAGLNLSWQEIAALELSGEDIFGAVHEATLTGNRAKLDQMRARVGKG